MLQTYAQPHYHTHSLGHWESQTEAIKYVEIPTIRKVSIAQRFPQFGEATT